ncbi:hypothetical protein [Olleya marilimosa]|uniref:hypothetical protein n=1 Tax=Olleya marilimosa TaxID=272164 RepID=UPI0030EBD738|tara:strand:+ start:6169 stop:7533 length:1365 start_codon:yes stop_codon:yes gene_type:complete
MALKQNNLSGPSLVSPSGQLATAANYIDPYSYAIQYQPELTREIHLQKGKGKLLPFCSIMGTLTPFASDEVRWAELGELHEAHEAVDRTANQFTTGTPHNLRVGDTILISDGTVEDQANVSAILSSTQFQALCKKDAGYVVGTSALTVSKFSNIWGKGEGNFTQGREDNPNYYTNHPHILKDFYTENESDMAHITWVKTPGYAGGEGWYATELGRTEDAYDNYIELTHLLHERAESGSDSVGGGFQRGMKGLVPQIEERGNIGTELITTTDALSDIAFRIKQQGGATSYQWWKDHAQMAAFRKMLAGENAHYLNGANYGIFNNSKETALELGFKGVYIDGITFMCSELRTLDEPELLGSAQLKNTSIQSLMIPNGEKNVLEAGDVYSKPYLNIRYRQMGGINRFKKVKFFGGTIGTDHKIDTFEMHIETEMTNQLVGANQFFVFRRGTGIYTGV